MGTDAAARLAAWADQHGQLAEDIRAVLAENRQQATGIAVLREDLDAARKFIEPIWLAMVARFVPLWRAIEPLLEQPDDAADEPQTGEAGPS